MVFFFFGPGKMVNFKKIIIFFNVKLWFLLSIIWVDLTGLKLNSWVSTSLLAYTHGKAAWPWPRSIKATLLFYFLDCFSVI